jgi:hypothetical protein
LARGQFEFVDGGIVQHDQVSTASLLLLYSVSNLPFCMTHLQACPNAYGIASQMTQGHRFLHDTFNATPRVGWSIDPFGSSSSNAALYALMQFDALIINRISSTDMDAMMKNKALEFVWQPSSSIPAARSEIFTHVFDSYFCMPGGNT